MGAASCKRSKPSEQDQGKENAKQITIGVFGLDNAGKTSTVKAIEGSPTKKSVPTTSVSKSTVPYPSTGKRDEKSHEPIQIIDVSGAKRFRDNSWADYYDQIHGLIFVMDASEKKRRRENKQTLDDLIDNDKLRNKPILILANKQDCTGAVADEDDVKEQLDIEQLKIKYKIELCTAISNNKKDDSIRKGFSWLIRSIEENYAAINARVNNTKNANRPKPNEKKANTKVHEASSDDDVSYSSKPTTISAFGRNNANFRSTNDSHKLSSSYLGKSASQPSGRETYDDDDNTSMAGARLHRTNSSTEIDDQNFKRSPNEFNASTANAAQKKKKLVGVSNNANKDSSNKKLTDKEPKSFRTQYETFPEEEPWLPSLKKTARTDDIMPKPFSKPSLTSDITKKHTSPLVNDTKPYGSSPRHKGSNYSDNDDDDSSIRDRHNSLFPPISRINAGDDDNRKLTLPYSTNKSSLSVKKTTSGIYGDDDDDKFNIKNNRRPFGTPPTTKKLTRFEEEDEEDNDNFKKSTAKTTKSFDSNDDDDKKKSTKSYLSSSDRLNLDSDYRRLTSKPPASPSSTIKRLKDDDDDDDSISSKPFNRSKFGTENYLSTSSKPLSRVTADDRNDRSLSTSKSSPYNKFNDDDNDKFNNKNNRRPFGTPPALKKLSRFEEEDEENNDSFKKSTAKTTKGFDSNDDDDDDDDDDKKKKLTKSYLSSSDRLNLDSDYRRLTSKPPASPSSTVKRLKDDDDDDDSISSKPFNRSRFGNDITKPLSSYKPITSLKKDDDDDDDYKSKSKVSSKFDDDDDLPSSSSKYANRSKFGNDYSTSLPSKPAARGKYDDDDDDDEPPSSTSKPSFRSNYENNGRSSPYSNSKLPSKFQDDDYPSSSSKIGVRSKFEDDDRPMTSPRLSSRPKHNDDDNMGKGSLRSRVGDDDFDSSKGGFQSARVSSVAANRTRAKMFEDD